MNRKEFVELSSFCYENGFLDIETEEGARTITLDKRYEQYFSFSNVLLDSIGIDKYIETIDEYFATIHKDAYFSFSKLYPYSDELIGTAYFHSEIIKRDITISLTVTNNILYIVLY